jgi:hypothetical protein
MFGPDEFHRDLTAAGRAAEEHLTRTTRAKPTQQPVTADLARVTRLERIHRRAPIVERQPAGESAGVTRAPWPDPLRKGASVK